MRLGGIVAIGVMVGCAPAPRPWPSPDPATFERLAAQLAQRRAARPSRPWSVGVHVLVREPRSGRTVEGRGAIAVAPGQAVRMILVGGAGSTMLDAWVSRERHRVAIPALDVVRRGREADAADLPVGFLRWWFLAPLSGQLVAAADEVEPVWLLRTEGAVVELRATTCGSRQGLLAIRHAGEHAERVLECRAHDEEASVGDTAEYDDLTSGLHVHVDVESVSASPPDAEAFRDPDLATGAP
jgi:hypothetical protein